MAAGEIVGERTGALVGKDGEVDCGAPCGLEQLGREIRSVPGGGAPMLARSRLAAAMPPEAKPPAPLSRAGGLRSADANANGCCALVNGRWRRC
jgi:hypothetical protein